LIHAFCPPSPLVSYFSQGSWPPAACAAIPSAARFDPNKNKNRPIVLDKLI